MAYISYKEEKRNKMSVINTKMHRNTKMDTETFKKWLNINKKVAYKKVTNCTKITKLVNLGKLLCKIKCNGKSQMNKQHRRLRNRIREH